MIKAIIFDLDGVLVDTKKIHFIALNKALKKNGIKKNISFKEHVHTYDGLPTKKKLEIFFKKKNINQKTLKKIYLDKKKITTTELKNNIKFNKRIFKIIQNLSSKYKVLVASNAVKETVKYCLKKLKIEKNINFFISNEDIKNPKPHPEIYLRCFLKYLLSPKECLIIEDSYYGITAANESGGHVLQINKLKEVTINNIKKKIKNLDNSNIKNTNWDDKNLNVLIPMAGEGSRFKDAGYTFPKPLIEVNKIPMIQLVIDNLSLKANYKFIVKEDHIKKYNIDSMLKIIKPNCDIIKVNKTTEGAACTALLAKKLINNENPLIIANSDQFIKWNSAKTMYTFMAKNIDGGILSFKASHPKWSYAKHNEEGIVSEVAEKKVISNTATVGIYFWRKGSDFVKYAEKMIKKNIRYKNEFYICPVFNEAIKDNKKILIEYVEEMWGLGTPEDLNTYLKNYSE